MGGVRLRTHSRQVGEGFDYGALEIELPRPLPPRHTLAPSVPTVDRATPLIAVEWDRVSVLSGGPAGARRKRLTAAVCRTAVLLEGDGAVGTDHLAIAVDPCCGRCEQALRRCQARPTTSRS